MSSNTHDPITEWVRVATNLHGAAIEDWLRLYIRPQPWWLPRPAWEWLIRRTILMVTSHADPTDKGEELTS